MDASNSIEMTPSSIRPSMCASSSFERIPYLWPILQMYNIMCKCMIVSEVPGHPWKCPVFIDVCPIIFLLAMIRYNLSHILCI